MYALISKIKKSLSLLLLSSCSCATTTKSLPRNAQNFDTGYEYKIETNSAVYSKLKASDIHKKDNQIIIQSHAEKVSLNISEINSIKGKSIHKYGNYKWEAAGIGALVTGVSVGVTSAFTGSCTESSFNSSDCKNLRLWGGLGFGLLGALAGGGIGFGIGHFIPKKDKIEISPTLDTQGNFGGNVSYKKEF